MKNMEKLGIFFSVLIICVTLFSVIQTGSSNSQNIPSIPSNQTYPTPTIVTKTIPQTTTTPLTGDNTISSPNFDEILRNSEWKGTSKDGRFYDLRINIGNFNQYITNDKGSKCHQVGRLTLNKANIEEMYQLNDCNSDFNGATVTSSVTWVSKDSFIVHMEGYDITYTRKYSI